MTQEKVAAVVGVTRKTIDNWEDGNKGKFTNTSIPDLRVSIPKTEHERIAERAKAAEQELTSVGLAQLGVK